MSETKFYWSREPGKFVNKKTGEEYPGKIEFSGTVREWYETLIETIVDVAHELQKSAVTGRGQVDVYVSENIETILQCSVLFHPSMAAEEIDGVKLSGTIRIPHPIRIILKRSMPKNEILVKYYPESPAIEGAVVVKDMN